MDNSIPSDHRSITLRVPGDLLSTNADALRNEAFQMLEANQTEPRGWDFFALDLSAAKMVDSVGLNLVVVLLKRVEARGGKLKILYSNPNVLRTFTFTRLDRHVELVKSWNS